VRSGIEVDSATIGKPRAVHYVGRALAVAGLIGLYLLVAATAPPFDDEIYYWCWAQNLQLSYFDHPPMTAYLIRPSLAVFGNSVLALRLPAVVTNLIVLGILAAITRPRSYLLWAFATPMFTFGAVLITPDTPLLLFWSLYLGWLVIVHRRLAPGRDDGPPRPVPLWLWLIGGLVLGGAGLGKYTAVLLVPSSFLSFLLIGPSTWRRWLPGYIFHGVIAGVTVLPVLFFNLQHDFAPFLYQWKHANQSNRSGLEPFLEFVAVQFALIGTGPIVLLPWAWRRIRKLAAEPTTRAAVALFVVPLTFFLYKAFRGPLEGNWAMASYLSFWPVAAWWYAHWATTRVRRSLAAAAYLIPLAFTVFLAVHLMHPLSIVPPAKDRIGIHEARFAAAARAAAAIRATGEALPVYAANYQWTALMRYYGIDAKQIEGATRPSNFTFDPAHVTDVDRAFVVNVGQLPAHLVPGFKPPEVVYWETVMLRGVAIDYAVVLRYERER
jgi:4-amino-4-deoxy-L-arabinose transferase-like glycosyltransferase